jgi:putative FmdB family regulatory protein
MPTYDYVCDGCEHEFEHRQSMSSNRLRTCPQCKKRKLRRLIGSGAGVIFKGSGFYETDYKRKSRGEPAKKTQSDSNTPSKVDKKDSMKSTSSDSAKSASTNEDG